MYKKLKQHGIPLDINTLKYYSIYLLLIFVTACSSSHPISSETNPQSTANETEPPNKLSSVYNSTHSGLDIDKYQSSLSDNYTVKSNLIPEGYNRIKIIDETESEKDLYEGYRVQIYSGQNVALADTIASIFRIWSGQNIEGYQADTYTFFKAPYYRVHVGDFHNRDRAYYFSNLLKRRFKDSWVVYDRIDPWKIPADTTLIYSKE